MLVTVSGITTAVTGVPGAKRSERSKKVESPILVTGNPLMESGITTTPPLPEYAEMVIAPLFVSKVNCAVAITGQSDGRNNRRLSQKREPEHRNAAREDLEIVEINFAPILIVSLFNSILVGSSISQLLSSFQARRKTVRDWLEISTGIRERCRVRVRFNKSLILRIESSGAVASRFLAKRRRFLLVTEAVDSQWDGCASHARGVNGGQTS